MRRYQPNKTAVIEKTVVVQKAEKPARSHRPTAWEDGKFWHSLKEGSAILEERNNNSYSYHNLARRIREGEFEEGYHFRKIGKDKRAIEVNIWRIIEG